MHKTLIIACLILAQTHAFCQTKNSSQSLERTSPHFTVRVNPLSMLDPLYPTLQISGKIIVGRYALVYTHGFLANYIFETHKPDSAAYSIVKNKLELNYHFDIGPITSFLGIQFFQGHYSERKGPGEFWADQKNYGYDKAVNDRRLYGLAFTSGMSYDLSRRLSLETTGAVGIQMMDNNYNDVIYDSLVRVRHDWIGITPSNRAGRRITPHLSFALNLGWRIF